MKAIVQSIEKYQHEHQAEILPLMNRLADEGQKPRALLLSCSDSRVVPGIIAATNPGTLFTVRNVGNIVPMAETRAETAVSSNAASTGAAIEFALEVLDVPNIIILGHADCGAMKQLEKEEDSGLPHLEAWLENAKPALNRYTVVSQEEREEDKGLKTYDALSRINVGVQLENLASYPSVQRRMKEGTLRLHGWWFDLRSASVQALDTKTGEWLSFDVLYKDLIEGEEPTDGAFAGFGPVGD